LGGLALDKNVGVVKGIVALPSVITLVMKTKRDQVRLGIWILSRTPKIIAHDQAENEPAGADRALQRAADL